MEHKGKTMNSPISHVSTDSQLYKYETWLRSQDFSNHTKRGYLSQVKQFLAFIGQTAEPSYDFATDPSRRDALVHEYSSYLRDSVKSRLSSINTTLTAIDNYYRFLGIGSSAVKREKPLCKAPKVLTPEEKARLLNILAACTSAKERAVVLLFLSTGVRLGECAALNVTDVALTPEGGRIFVRNEKGKGSRTLPVDETTRKALVEWQIQRTKCSGNLFDQALFINYSGQRISTQGLDLIVRKLGIRAGLVLSAQVLRDTFLTELANSTKDAFVVAKISGHMRLDSTRKYFDVGAHNQPHPRTDHIDLRARA
jgi:site-specific recombinase XerD